MRQKTSFWAWIGHEVCEAPAVVTERIRKAMLFALDTHCGPHPKALDLKICLAQGIAELWYLRPDLMQMISVSTGEAVARDVLTQITALFEGHHPMPTPSRFAAL